MLARSSSFRAAVRALGSVRRQTTRAFHRGATAQSRLHVPVLLAVGAATGAAYLAQQSVAECAWYDAFLGKKEPQLDPVWNSVRESIQKIIDADPTYGPLFVRLAWHAAGTYDAKTNTGGSNGATMRFEPECLHGANNGLKLARDALAPIQAANPGVSVADVWTFAGSVAIESMGGPKIPWRPGRTDAKDGSSCPADGRLPDASKDATHIRDIFYRMGFNDQEIVALIGAHTLGFCHADRSGYVGPWTRDPFGFDNSFYTLLLEEPWRVKKGSNPVQFEDSTGELMMLPADLALIIDPKFRKYVEMYAKDEALWHKDFAATFGRLLGLGVPPPQEKKQ